MGKSKPGDPGQAGTFNPKGGGKFEPTAKAKQSDQSDNDDPTEGGGRPNRPRPK